MNRREFSNLLGGAATLWSQRAYAQQQAAPSSPIRREWLDRRKELGDRLYTGYKPGRNWDPNKEK
jgi:hypothetical protein